MRRTRPCLLLVLLVVMGEACRGGAGAGAGSGAAAAIPSASPRVVAPMMAGAQSFGDSTIAGVRILAFDKATEQARIAARSTNNLIVLAVVPGREIELLVPGQYALQRERQTGHRVLDLRRIDDAIDPNGADGAVARAAYERCVRQANAARARQQQQKRVVRRDSTGKVIGDGGAIAAPPTQVAEVECNRLDRSAKRPSERKYLSARPPAERYLVVLFSSASVPVAVIAERLATLSAVAPDAATTIEAIAAGLYLGTKGTWGGTFVSW